MRAKQVPANEQFRLVMECRKSGLSDYRWCKENDIRPGTFYNWVTRLRRKGCKTPESAGADTFLPSEHQDVVKVDIVPDESYQDQTPTDLKTPAVVMNTGIVMKLEIGNASLSISNGTDPALLSQVVRILRGDV